MRPDIFLLVSLSRFVPMMCVRILFREPLNGTWAGRNTDNWMPVDPARLLPAVCLEYIRSSLSCFPALWIPSRKKGSKRTALVGKRGKEAQPSLPSVMPFSEWQHGRERERGIESCRWTASRPPAPGITVREWVQTAFFVRLSCFWLCARLRERGGNDGARGETETLAAVRSTFPLSLSLSSQKRERGSTTWT